MSKFATSMVLSLTIFTGLLVFQGCTKNPLGTVKVSGTVTLDGEPADGVTVAFYPVAGEGRECSGITDAQGRFVLTIPGAAVGSGAIPGEYAVGFIKQKSATEGMTDEEIAKKFKNTLPYPIDLLPTKYADRTATDIPPVKVVKGGKNQFAFELFSK